MNKRSLIKFVLSLLALIFILSFEIKIENFSWVILLPLLPLITIYMYKYKNNIKKYNFIYNVILLLLIFFTFLISAYLIIVMVQTLDYLLYDGSIFFNIFNLYLILKILIDSIIDFKNNTNKLNDYLAMLVLIIINLIFVRYYLNINLIINRLDAPKFIYQNYAYFFIMLLIIEFHKHFSNKLSK